MDRYYKEKDKYLDEDEQIEDEEAMYFDHVVDEDDDMTLSYDDSSSSSSSSAAANGDDDDDDDGSRWMMKMNITHHLPPPSDEKRLTKYLLQNYRKVGPGGRPIVNSSLPLRVQFGLAMIQMDLNERDNTLTISVWCRYVSSR